jgi:hypothetical protein
MAETQVALGGQIYTVRRMPTARAVAWRKRANAIVEALPAIAEQYAAEGDDLVKSAGKLLGVASDTVEAMMHLVIDADVRLQADKEHILDSAFDDEYLEAFQSILLLNAPLAGAAHSIMASTGEPSATT